MTRSQSPSTTILEQLEEKPGEWNPWVNFCKKGYPLIRWRGREVYIAIYESELSARKALERLDRRHLYGDDPIELPIIVIGKLYQFRDRPSYSGLAFCDEAGEVSEWRRWA